MLAQTAFQRVGQRITLLTVVFANERYLVFQTAQAQILSGDHLRQHIGVQISGLLNDNRLLRQPVRHHNPANTHTRRQNFGEGRGVDHLIFTTQFNRVLVQRALYFIGKANFTVRVVFNDDEIMLLRQFYQATATVIAQSFAARVAKGRHQVNGFHASGGKQLSKLFYQHAVVVGINAQNVGLRQLEDLQRRQIGWAFNDNRIARIEQRAGHDIQRLLRARSDIHVTCLTCHTACLTQCADGLTQRRVAFGQTVLERVVKAFAHHLLHRQLQPFGIKKLRGRNAATERNHAGQFTVF